MAEQPAIDPMHQFLVHKIVDIPPVNLGGFMLDLSITNSIATLLVGTLMLMVFIAATAQGRIVPNRAQATAEALYNIIDKVLVGPIIGHGGKPYIPFVFTIFMLILTLNLMSVVLAIGNIGGSAGWSSPSP
jgi:F-type H+-transporting ATPase subunit a